MAKNIVIVLAGGSGERLLALSARRAKPAVPFGGHYRIIDFTLSNCVNSGLSEIFVLTQYRPGSLMKHLEFGKPWHLGGNRSTLLVLQPHGASEGLSWYKGNADAVWQNLHLIQERTPKCVLILAGDHIYKMDYRPLIDFHRARGSALTVAVKRVNPSETPMLGTCVVDDGRILEFEEKSTNPKSNLASMGIYVFEPEALIAALKQDAEDERSSHDFGKDILPRIVRNGEAFAYEFAGYWRDVGTIDAYFEANMDLVGIKPAIDLDDGEWPILSRFPDQPAAYLSQTSSVTTSLVCDGATVEGKVEQSIISPGVVVEPGAVVRNSIVLHNTRIQTGAKVNLSIVDKNSVIGSDSKVGSGIDFTPNRRYPSLLTSGITLIGKGSYIPDGSTIGRNCVVEIERPKPGPLRIPSGTWFNNSQS